MKVGQKGANGTTPFGWANDIVSDTMHAENWEKGEEETPRGTPDTMTDSKENQTE